MALANPATVQMCEQQCEALLATPTSVKAC